MRYFYIIILIHCFYFVKAQSDSVRVLRWKKSIESGLNLNQASFSNNWKGGGVNSIALGTYFSGRALYESNKISFDNNVQLQYGFLKNQYESIRKTTDRIFADSKFGYKLNKWWDAFVGVNFLSQFAPGYNYIEDSTGQRKELISQFFSPAYLTSTLGFEYKPVDYFWVRFGVGGFRQTFVLDTTIYHHVPQNYGVPIGKKVRNELAFVLTANFDKDIAKNINLKVRFMAFSNYEDMAATDLRTDILLTAKVNKLVNVNLSGVVLYDQDQDYKVQYSQSLALGVVYKFTQFEEKK
jgi:hypothetical protein